MITMRLPVKRNTPRLRQRVKQGVSLLHGAVSARPHDEVPNRTQPPEFGGPGGTAERQHKPNVISNPTKEQNIHQTNSPIRPTRKPINHRDNITILQSLWSQRVIRTSSFFGPVTVEIYINMYITNLRARSEGPFALLRGPSGDRLWQRTFSSWVHHRVHLGREATGKNNLGHCFTRRQPPGAYLAQSFTIIERNYSMFNDSRPPVTPKASPVGRSTGRQASSGLCTFLSPRRPTSRPEWPPSNPACPSRHSWRS